MRKALVIIGYLCALASPAAAADFGDTFREWLLGPEVQASTRESMAVQLDAVSQSCMGCHNGTAATHISLKNARSPLQALGTMNVNHPVGMDYGEYASRNPLGYQPGALLDPNIRLVDGKVGCVSCHQLKVEMPQAMAVALSAPAVNSICPASRRLTVGPKKSDLCLACHIK